MIRILVRIDDANMAANVGGSVLTTYRTFDVNLIEVEKLLAQNNAQSLVHAQVVGVEVLLAEPAHD